MLSRRSTLGAAAVLAAGGWSTRAAAQTGFDQLFDTVLADPALLAARDPREVLAANRAKSAAPRFAPSPAPISPRAIKMVIAFEVNSRAAYEARYSHPVRPGGQSGVTVGIGYDLGYARPAWLDEDWRGLLEADTRNGLKTVCGKTGRAAQAALASVRSLSVPWASADTQFRTTGFPRYAAQLLSQNPPQTLPNARKLPLDCFGALLSLAYNRGASFSLAGARYAQMRAIRLHMVDEAYHRIPGEIRAMKPLWAGKAGLDGLVQRRELEALLFEEGLKAG